MASAYYAALTAGPVGERGRIELQRQALLNDRKGGGFDAHWQDIADVTMPRRVRFTTTDRNKGSKTNQLILDSTGRFAARTLGSGLHAGLTSPARPWMKLTTPDPELAQFAPVKEWLHTVTTRMLTVFGQSNLYNALPITYLDMGLFGTGAMAQVTDERDLFRFYSFPVGSYGLSLNARGTIGAFYREFERTVRQVVQEFLVVGTGIDWTRGSSRLKNLWDKGQYEEAVTLGWYVAPNENRRTQALNAFARKPFVSYHFEIDSETIEQQKAEDLFLRKSGFDTFPIHAPRWDVTSDDCYGTDSPGMSVLGDIRQLQGMARKKGQLLAKAVDPPLTGPSALRSQKVSLVAGDITYQDVRDANAGLRPIHEPRLEGYQHLTQDIEMVKQSVRRGFYEDLFLMLANSDPSRGMQPMTAREVDERHEEKLLALGPVLERTNDELLDPLIDRTFSMMQGAGLIPEPPDELQKVQLKVEYVSIMAQAQKLVGVVGQDRFIASTLPLAEAFPEIKHKIKPFVIVNDYAEMLGVNPNQLRTDEEAEALMQQEQEQAAAMQQAEMMKNAGAGMGAAGQNPIAQNSPLDQVLGGMTPSIDEGVPVQ